MLNGAFSTPKNQRCQPQTFPDILLQLPREIPASWTSLHRPPRTFTNPALTMNQKTRSLNSQMINLPLAYGPVNASGRHRNWLLNNKTSSFISFIAAWFICFCRPRFIREQQWGEVSSARPLKNLFIITPFASLHHLYILSCFGCYASVFRIWVLDFTAFLTDK